MIDKEPLFVPAKDANEVHTCMKGEGIFLNTDPTKFWKYDNQGNVVDQDGCRWISHPTQICKVGELGVWFDPIEFDFEIDQEDQCNSETRKYEN